MRGFLTILTGAAVAVVLPLWQAAAQEHDVVKAVNDWSVFEAGEGSDKVCWIASSPTDSRAMRGGNSVEVRRGDIFLMVSFRPGNSVENEVSFLAGYPFKSGSKVEAEVGSDSYEMFTSGESAWLSSSDKDEQVVQAFKRGADAKLKGLSSRGTTTVDTFSLIGFTDAVEEAAKLCG